MLGDAMKLNNIFGYNVKYFRYKENYTQEKLAELTDTSVTYISLLETGRHHTPSFDKIETLTKALKVQPFELFVPRSKQKLPNRVDMTHPK